MGLLIGVLTGGCAEKRAGWVGMVIGVLGRCVCVERHVGGGGGWGGYRFIVSCPSFSLDVRLLHAHNSS